jgi:hypothetical protein
LKATQQELFGRIDEHALPALGVRLQASLHYHDLYVVLVWLQADRKRPVMDICIQLRGENCLEWNNPPWTHAANPSLTHRRGGHSHETQSIGTSSPNHQPKL